MSDAPSIQRILVVCDRVALCAALVGASPPLPVAIGVTVAFLMWAVPRQGTRVAARRRGWSEVRWQERNGT